VDYRAAGKFDRMFLARKLKKYGLKALAEKVETQEEFQEAVGLGYELFQGYFFEKPLMLKGRDPAGVKQNYLRILQEIHSPTVDFSQLEEIFKLEIALTYKLLRYVNSAFYQKASRIESIQQALLIMGDEGVRKWVTLVAVPEFAKGKPNELAVTAIQRARTCELLAPLAGLSHRQTDLFLMGMFSLLDALMDRPLETLLEGLHLAPDVRRSLLDPPDADNPLSNLYHLTLGLEKADWPLVWQAADRLSVRHEDVAEVYLEATKWADAVMRFSSRPAAPAAFH
jgi:c-di-GMP-related signal transduction protein